MDKYKDTKLIIVSLHEINLQIEEKEKRAEELIVANQEHDSFSYSVSHYPRTRLRAINDFIKIS